MASQPLPTLSYQHRTKDTLTGVTLDLADDLAALVSPGPSLELAERRHVRKENVTLDWQLHWEAAELKVRLWGRPENRSFQVYLVVEEAVRSGEGFADVAWIHTPVAAEVVNQLTLVPESFFRDERQALESGERLWDDILRHFAESAEVGPGDPIASAVFEGRRMRRESASTATLSATLDLRFDALRHHRPEVWAASANLTRGSQSRVGERG